MWSGDPSDKENRRQECGGIVARPSVGMRLSLARGAAGRGSWNRDLIDQAADIIKMPSEPHVQ